MFVYAAPTSAASRNYPGKVLTRLTVLFLLGMLVGCKSQDKVPYAYSSTTDYYDALNFERTKRYEPLALYTYHPNDFLIGNNCVTEYTKTMGFEYSYPFTRPNQRPNKLYTFFHNSYINVRLLGRLGFGWKRKVKTRIKQCKTSSGDFPG
jgi:hypothetical protein